jgi:hypothetical protein
MGWEQLEDQVDKVIRSSVLAETVTYTVVGGGPLAVQAVYARSGADLGLSDEIVIAADFPRLGVRIADLAAAPQSGDLVTARTIAYRVFNVTLHGAGTWAELALEEA